jgi:hypothetical protein
MSISSTLLIIKIHKIIYDYIVWKVSKWLIVVIYESMIGKNADIFWIGSFKYYVPILRMNNSMINILSIVIIIFISFALLE